MNSINFKKRAMINLEGNWMLVMVSFMIVGIVTNSSNLQWLDVRLGSLGLVTILLFPIYVGQARLHYNIALGKDGNLEDLLSSFNSKEYARALLGVLLHIILLIGWTLFFILPVFIKVFSYAMINYILQDQEFDHLNPKEAITKSREIMDGHKLELFFIVLSFLGWIILSLMTFGVLFFFTLPYMQQTVAEFYLELKEENK